MNGIASYNNRHRAGEGQRPICLEDCARVLSKSKTTDLPTAGPDFSETALTAMLIGDGGKLAYEPVDLLCIEAIEFKVKPEAGGISEVRSDGSEGPLIAKVDVRSEEKLSPSGRSQQAKTNVGHDKAIQTVPEEAGSAYEGWQNVKVPVEDPGGTHTLHLIARGEEGTLMQIDYLGFMG